MAILTITAKGQMTLTPELLRHLNVAPGQKVEVTKLPNGQLMIQAPVRTGSIEEFNGSLAKAGTPRLTIAQIKKITEEAWAGKR
jgi:antitoxin component of MazEF toxin-antitoxin module